MRTEAWPGSKPSSQAGAPVGLGPPQHAPASEVLRAQEVKALLPVLPPSTRCWFELCPTWSPSSRPRPAGRQRGLRSGIATAKEAGAAWPFQAKPERFFGFPGGGRCLGCGVRRSSSGKEALRTKVPLGRSQWCQRGSQRPSPQPSSQATVGPPLPHRRRARGSRRPRPRIVAASLVGARGLTHAGTRPAGRHSGRTCLSAGGEGASAGRRGPVHSLARKPP